MNDQFITGFIKSAQARGFTAIEAHRLLKEAGWGDRASELWRSGPKVWGDEARNAWDGAVDNSLFKGIQAGSRWLGGGPDTTFDQTYNQVDNEYASARSQTMLGQMNSYRDLDKGGIGNTPLIQRRSQQMQQITPRLNLDQQSNIGGQAQGIYSTYDANKQNIDQNALNHQKSTQNLNKTLGWNGPKSIAPTQQTAGFKPMTPPKPIAPAGPVQTDSPFIKTQMPRMSSNNNFGMGPQRPVHL